jgi:hypothetical protein
MFPNDLSSIQVHKQSIINIHTYAHNRSIFNIFHFFVVLCVHKSKKQKELKRQKQEKDNYFVNLKEREDS